MSRGEIREQNFPQRKKKSCASSYNQMRPHSLSTSRANLNASAEFWQVTLESEQVPWPVSRCVFWVSLSVQRIRSECTEDTFECKRNFCVQGDVSTGMWFWVQADILKESRRHLNASTKCEHEEKKSEHAKELCHWKGMKSCSQTENPCSWLMTWFYFHTNLAVRRFYWSFWVNGSIENSLWTCFFAGHTGSDVNLILSS